MAKRQSLFNDLLDEILDTVMDQVEEAVRPSAKAFAKILDQEARRIVADGMGAQQAHQQPHQQAHQHDPHKRSRTGPRSMGGQRSSAPPPPRPASPHPPQLTLYSVLGVAPSARPQVIKAAYKAMALIFHPDVPGTGDKARMQEIGAAYEVLGDAGKRRAYDKEHGIR